MRPAANSTGAFASTCGKADSMTSSTRLRARSFGSRPDRIRLLITLSEIEPTGCPLCMTGIWENFQRRISSTAEERGIFASTDWTLRLWICSTSAFFTCFFSSACNAFMIRRTLSYDGFIWRFSIFTIVDWLTFARRAIAVCVRPRAFRSRGISSRSGIIGPGKGFGYIFVLEFSSQWDIIGARRERTWRTGPSGENPFRGQDGQKPYRYGRIHTANSPGDPRATEHLCRGARPHADRRARGRDRRTKRDRPSRQHRGRACGDRLGRVVQDVSQAVRPDPPSQHGPGRGRRRSKLPQVRRRRVPRARV